MNIEKEIEKAMENQKKQYALIQPGKKGPVITNIRMNKLVVPDRKSTIKVGHFHRVMKMTHDTKPHDPHRGVVFMLVEHAPDCAVCWKIRVMKYYSRYRKITDKYCKNIFILHPFALEDEIEQMGYHYSPPGIDGVPVCNCDKCLTPEKFEQIARDLYEKNLHEMKRKEQTVKDRRKKMIKIHLKILGGREFVIENPRCSTCGDKCEYVKKIVINSDDYIKLIADWQDGENETEEYLSDYEYDFWNFEVNEYGDEITYCYENTKIVYNKDGVKYYTFDCDDFNPVCGI